MIFAKITLAFFLLLSYATVTVLAEQAPDYCEVCEKQLRNYSYKFWNLNTIRIYSALMNFCSKNCE